MRVRYFIIAILIFSSASFLIKNCSQFEKGSKLMDNFKSYMSIEEARLTLPAHLREWEVFIEQPDFQVILVKNYQSLEFIGQLSLVFTDGKNLSGTCFLTSEMYKYVKKLEKKNNIQLKKGMSFLETEIFPHTEVYVRTNYQGEICWYDESFKEHYLFY